MCFKRLRSAWRCPQPAAAQPHGGRTAAFCMTSQGAPCLHFCGFHGTALQYLPLTPVPLFPGPVPRLSPLGPPPTDVDAFCPGLGAGPGRRSCVVVVLPALPHGPAWRPCLVNRNSVFHYEIHIWQKYETIHQVHRESESPPSQDPQPLGGVTAGHFSSRLLCTSSCVGFVITLRFKRSLDR